MSLYNLKTDAHIGLVGLGVMGANLALNILDKGYKLDICEVNANLRERHSPQLAKFSRCVSSVQDLLHGLAKPRCILLLVTAGDAVDSVMQQLIEVLDSDDIIVDLGNSHYMDTERRISTCSQHGISFVGCGISGGSSGARLGPALMPGGCDSAKAMVEPLLLDIAAVFAEQPCCHWVGSGGSGHFVKMVHNGIEYADMQLIAETYHLMRNALSLSCRQIADVFTQWNQGELESYLLDITSRILSLQDTNGTAAVDCIVDRAGQKGTGSWTSESALRYGVPATMLAESVFARMVSSFKDKRVKLSANSFEVPGDLKDVPSTLQLKQALYAAKLLAYTQGFDLMSAASDEHKWSLDLKNIAGGWRAGCVIRGHILKPIMAAFEDTLHDGLMASEPFSKTLKTYEASLRSVVLFGLAHKIPMPVFSAALAYYDGFHTAQLPANLIQAQRDFFGSHGFERVGAEADEKHHFDWTADQV